MTIKDELVELSRAYVRAQAPTGLYAVVGRPGGIQTIAEALRVYQNPMLNLDYSYTDEVPPTEYSGSIP